MRVWGRESNLRCRSTAGIDGSWEVFFLLLFHCSPGLQARVPSHLTPPLVSPNLCWEDVGVGVSEGWWVGGIARDSFTCCLTCDGEILPADIVFNVLRVTHPKLSKMTRCRLTSAK